MNRHQATLLACGTALSVLWGYFAAPIFEHGERYERDWFNPGVLLGWAVIWLICSVGMFRKKSGE